MFENLKKALAAVGADFSHVVRMTTYFTDPRHREAVGEVRRIYFGDALPASTQLIVVGLANPDYLLEIEATAVID